MMTTFSAIDDHSRIGAFSARSSNGTGLLRLARPACG
jgi:hypothetical protein